MITLATTSVLALALALALAIVITVAVAVLPDEPEGVLIDPWSSAPCEAIEFPAIGPGLTVLRCATETYLVPTEAK